MQHHDHHGSGGGQQPMGTADPDTNGQAMPVMPAHSAVDEDHQKHEHWEHAGHRTAMFRDRFWSSRVLSIHVVVFRHMVVILHGYQVPQFPRSAWVPPVRGTISTVVVALNAQLLRCVNLDPQTNR